MKISGHYKRQGDDVKFKTDYDNLERFDKVYVAKVFTDTPLPVEGLFGNPLDAPNIIKGGTGFFFDKAEPLPPEIEHAMPDYHFYDSTCDAPAYTDYSIGFLTRGCFRHCPFCVNRRANKVVAHSPLKEFLDPTRKKICLLDDNFFGYKGWRDLLIELRETGKPFVFKQGLDIRLLDEERAELLLTSHYDGDFIFAFDDVKDAPLIEDKINLISRYINLQSNRIKFYVLCGYDRQGLYDEDFWRRDIQSVFTRVALLKKYACLPYLMRHENYKLAPQPRLYSNLARWCNQPQFFLKKSFADFLAADNTYKRRISNSNPFFFQGGN